ncbi:MAG TPA: molybdate ABC transporter substrate-binding protein [Candidatus Azoamicus sp.]
MKKIYIIFFICVIITTALSKECELKIAVASNFLGTFKSFVGEFESQYSCKVFLISDSSSNLYSKFINGADFDIFLTADKNHYFLLSKINRYISSNLSFLGKLSVYSQKTSIKKNLFIHIFFYNKLSLANKKLAPYGYASFECINNLKIKYNDFIFGNNINQTFIFINSFNSDIGFVSLSQNILHLTHAKNFFKVPNYLYSKIKQDMILLTDKYLCKVMENFVKTEYVKKIIIKNGYKILE